MVRKFYWIKFFSYLRDKRYILLCSHSFPKYVLVIVELAGKAGLVVVTIVGCSSGSNKYDGSDGEDDGMCLVSAFYKPDTVYLRGCAKA